jgi:amino acid permease
MPSGLNGVRPGTRRVWQRSPPQVLSPPSRASSSSRPPTSRRADESPLRRSVGALDLTALGIGAIIGTGIFVIIGEAIAL